MKLDTKTTLVDGESFEHGDYLIRCRVEPDYDSSVNDAPDCYGTIGDSRRDHDTGREQRPEGFTGNAEKLWYGNYGPWWWEPPKDVKRSDPNFSEFRDTVRELLAFGFVGVVIELCLGCDHYGHPIVIDSESLWSIDSRDDKYIREVSGELIEEVMARHE